MNRPKSHRPGHPSKKYEDHARSIDGQEWRAPHPYIEGVSVTWRGIKLVCTRGHYAGDNACHPWDPGSGWAPEHGATLWAPDGPEQTTALLEAMTHFLVERRPQVLEDDEYPAIPVEDRTRPTFSAEWLRRVVVEHLRRAQEHRS